MYNVYLSLGPHHVSPTLTIWGVLALKPQHTDSVWKPNVDTDTSCRRPARIQSGRCLCPQMLCLRSVPAKANDSIRFSVVVCNCVPLQACRGKTGFLCGLVEQSRTMPPMCVLLFDTLKNAIVVVWARTVMKSSKRCEV
jgi:hypothetical protein